MPGFLSALLMLSGAVAVAAPAVPDLELIVQLPGTLEKVQVELFVEPAPESGVRINYTSIKTQAKNTYKKRFDADTLKQLRKLWGAQTFDLKGWPTELGCDHYITWRVSAAGESRTICRDEARSLRLGELQTAIQRMMRN